MKPTLMQHQREQDDAAEIEARAEVEKRDCKDKLLSSQRYEYHARNFNNRISETYLDEGDTLNALYDVARDEVKLALSRLNDDPLEAVRILKEARAAAVDYLVNNTIDFEEVAELCREIERQEAA